MKALAPFLLLFLIGASLVYSQPTLTTKAEGGKYAVYLTTHGKTSTILQGLPKEPSISRIDERLFKITLSVGSPASYTYFVDSNKEKLEGPFFLVQALNEENMGIIYVGKDGKLTSKLLFRGIDPVSYDLPDLSPVAVVTNAIRKIEFVSDISIRVTYLSGSDFTEKTVVLHWPQGNK